MGLGNAIPIRFHGEVLAVVDPAEIHSVEPYMFTRTRPLSIWERLWGWLYRFYTGKGIAATTMRESWTKIAFKDGTWLKVRMPFFEFVEAYC